MAADDRVEFFECAEIVAQADPQAQRLRRREVFDDLRLDLLGLFFRFVQANRALNKAGI